MYLSAYLHLILVCIRSDITHIYKWVYKQRCVLDPSVGLFFDKFPNYQDGST